MKKPMIIGAACLVKSAFAASTVSWPSLPNGSLPDTEAVTNITLEVDIPKVREVVFQLDAPNCASNEVVVAVGHDADDDGDLAISEASFFFWNDCGDEYMLNCVTGEATEGIHTVKVKARDYDPSWDTVKVIKRGLHVINEAVSMTTDDKKFVISVR